MARGWFGAGILVVFLVLGVVTGIVMNDAHAPTEKLLEQAAEKTLSGDFENAVPLAMAAKSRWERQRNGTAAVADHSPMEDVDTLFAEMEVYARTEEKPHFAACCSELARRVQAMADAHAFSWWNVL